MYPPILNCGYRNDKIVFDWTEYEPPIEDARRYTRNHKEEKTLFRDRHLSNELNGSGINERKKDGITMRFSSQKGDMAKSVDATDLIGLSLGMETY
jgi:hypothetical protein